MSKSGWYRYQGWGWLPRVLLWTAVMSAPPAQAHLRDLVATPEPQHTVIVVEQTLPGLRPEMLDWWWRNLGREAAFQRWHPEANQSFQWLHIPPTQDDLAVPAGAVLAITQILGGSQVHSQWRFLQPAVRCVGDDHRVQAQITFPGDETLGSGLVRYDYGVSARGDDLLLRTTYSLPDGIVERYPEYVEALASYTEVSMQNLQAFLPQWFQTHYVEEALLPRGSYEMVANGWLTKKVIVNQEILGITPDMLDWWWDNINTTNRYRGWHPTAHVSFRWLVPPSRPDSLDYSVGAVQQVREYIGPYASNLLITWLDPAAAEGQVEYEHWIVAKTDLKALSGILPQRLIHEYQTNDNGDGIVMRSTFTVPVFFDWVMPGFSRSLGEHAIQEMQFLPNFLPALFEQEYSKNRQGCGQCEE
ncbi:DAPG hydrolase family protein [Ketobacter sp.]|uniref:DAPG hydrolase family protein n=1 Tax=Ketobacter sp. TaxID=2083498 RepID=UPI0025BCAF44|nr:hypothetical protein [Ketobacter sp.]